MDRLESTIEWAKEQRQHELRTREVPEYRDGAWRLSDTPEREKRRAYQRRYYKAHPKSQESVRTRGRIYMALRRSAAWADLKAQYDHRCACCGRQEPEIKLTVDHVIPLNEGGAPGIENVQPLCTLCNYNKGQRIIDYRPRWSIQMVVSGDALTSS